MAQVALQICFSMCVFLKYYLNKDRNNLITSLSIAHTYKIFNKITVIAY